MARDLIAEKNKGRNLLGPTAAQQGAKATAEELSPFEALGISFGGGMRSIGEAIGLAEPIGDEQALAALDEAAPIAAPVGRAIGQAAPFIPAGLAAGAIPALGTRTLASTAIGGLEGGAIANAENQELLSGAGIGAGISGGIELLFPVASRIGGALVRRITGKTPEGAVLDASGNPTPELQSALQEAGLTMEDLTVEAKRVVETAKAGSDPAQVARAARAEVEGVPLTRGELTGDFAQQTTEQRLLESASDPLADRFRAFKLRQSEAVRNALESAVDTSKLPEETGEAIKGALEGRKKLLRTQKNELYKEALDNATDVNGLPLFVDDIAGAIPDQATVKRLNRVTDGKADDVLDTLAEFGVGTREGIDDIQPLSVANFEDLRQTLNGIERADQTGGVKVLTRPIIEALDGEIDNLASRAEGLGEAVVGPLKEARKLTRTLKTEFSPQSATGKLVGVARDGATPIVESSRVYNKLSSKAMPVENVRRTVASLKKAGAEGATALADLQNTTMLDLIDAGFSTASRKIQGETVFNAGAFNKRIETIGEDKLKAIFSGNPKAMAKIKNIKAIAKDLQPPAGAVPKGSASVIMDMANKLGVIGITSKVPMGGALIETITRLGEGAKSRKLVNEALDATPEVRQIANVFDQSFPNIASALGIAGVSQIQQGNEQ